MRKVLFLLLFTATICSVRSQMLREHPIFKDYLNTGDIDDFCEAYRIQFGRECKSHISDKVESMLVDHIARVSDYKLRAFMDEHVMIADPALDMSDEECIRFRKETRKAPNDQMLDILEKYVHLKGHYFLRRDIRAMKTIRVASENIRASDSCNIGFHTRNLGEVKKGWKLKYLNPVIENFKNGLEIIKSKIFHQSHMDAKEPIPADSVHTAQCYGEHDDRFVLNNLGLKAVEYLENDSLIKTLLMFLSRCVCYYRKFQAMDDREVWLRTTDFFKDIYPGLITALFFLAVFEVLGSSDYVEQRAELLTRFGKIRRRLRTREVRAIAAVSATLLITAGLHQGYLPEELAYAGSTMCTGYSIGLIKKAKTARLTLNIILGINIACCITAGLIGYSSFLWLLSTGAMNTKRVFSAIRRAFRRDRRQPYQVNIDFDGPDYQMHQHLADVDLGLPTIDELDDELYQRLLADVSPDLSNEPIDGSTSRSDDL